MCKIALYTSNSPDVMKGKKRGRVIDGLTLDNTYYKCSPQTTDIMASVVFFY
jgi:hypothetical protein